MKKYLEALWEGFGTAFNGFTMLFIPILAVYVFIETIPKLTGWGATAAAIGSCGMIISGIGMMVHTGLEEIHKDEDVKFVQWILDSGKQEYIEIYKQWRKERK